jgi:hypothetical protein
MEKDYLILKRASALRPTGQYLELMLLRSIDPTREASIGESADFVGADLLREGVRRELERREKLRARRTKPKR